MTGLIKMDITYNSSCPFNTNSYSCISLYYWSRWHIELMMMLLPR